MAPGAFVQVAVLLTGPAAVAPDRVEFHDVGLSRDEKSEDPRKSDEKH